MLGFLLYFFFFVSFIFLSFFRVFFRTVAWSEVAQGSGRGVGDSTVFFWKIVSLFF